jgi:hypothetical protein
MSQPITPPVPPDPPPIIPDYPGYSGLGYIIVAKLPITAQITTIIEVRDYDDE